MDTASARARLADLATEDGSPTIATSLERADIEQALGLADGPPELVLDVLRRTEGDEEERLQLAVEWTREDLEALLRRAEGTPLILEFDAESIQRALQEAEVESHGFREKAVILAAVAATAAGAGTAGAVPTDPGSASGPASLAAEVTRPDDAAGARTTPASIAAEVRPGEYGAPRAMPADYPAADYGMPRAMPADYPAADYGMPRAMPADYAPDYGMPRAMPTDYPVGDTGGGGFTVPAPSPGEATLLTGGIALLIAAAAFAATRRRERISPA